MMEMKKIIGYPFVGAEFIAPRSQADARHPGRNELRPYKRPHNLFMFIIAPSWIRASLSCPYRENEDEFTTIQ